MKAPYSLPLLAVTVLCFHVASLQAEQPAGNSANGLAANADYVLEDSDQIPPVPILRLEKELGRDLTPEQEAELKKAHQERVQQIININKEFIGQVSEITELTPKEILPRTRLGRANAMRAGANRPAAMAGKGKRAAVRNAVAEGRFLERLDLIMEAKGDNLTGSDRRRVDRAWDDRTKAVLAVQEDFAKDVAAIAKVSSTKVKRLLKVA